MSQKKIIIPFIILIFLGLFLFHNLSVLAAEDTCQPTVPCSTESTPAAIPSEEDSGQKDGTLCVYYFWGAGCSSCASLKPFMDALSGKYQDKTDFKNLEIYYNPQNYQLFEDFVWRYQVQDAGVPAVFIGDTYLGGVGAIKEHLEEKISYFLTHEAPCPLDVNKVSGNTEEPKKLKLTLLTVVIAALADSINPCAFAVLIFLLVYLLGIKAQKRILKVGLTFILVVFATYFLSGLGILKLVQFTKASRWVALAAGMIAIVAGLINIKDFFWYGRGITLKIPESKKPLLESYIKKASVPAAAILGFLVSAFELPCTSGIYLAILGLLAGSSKNTANILYLLLYNLIFVLPLFVILAVVSLDVAPEKLESLRVEKRKWLKLVMGLVMVGVGLIVLMGAV